MAVSFGRVSRVIAIGVLGTLLASVAVTIGATPASAAASATVKVSTQRMSEPRLTSTQVGTYAANSVVSLLCYSKGQAVSGYFSPYVPGGTSDIWYLVSDGYFIADIDIETGSNNPVTGACPVAFTASPAPAISGTVAVGKTVTANVGSWSPSPSSVAYQWLRNGVAISGATGATYKLGTADGGTKLSVKVTAARSYFTTTTRTSAATTVLKAFTTAPTPTISGSVTVGSTLTANPGTWVPGASALNYQWLRGGSAISGATAKTYTLSNADSGAQIAVRVTASTSGFLTTSATSATKSVPRVFTAAPAPKISGAVGVGSTVTAVTGTWTPTPSSFLYQWYLDGKPISGATTATYKLLTADLGKTLKVAVTARATGVTSKTTVSSGSVVQKSFAVTAAPTITGTARVGETLTAHAGTWSPKPSALAYRWYRNGSPISGATAATYKLTSADGGQKVQVVVTAALAGYASKAISSTSVVVDPGKVVFTTSISGSAVVGSTVTASVSSTGAAASSWGFQWYVGGSPVSGATGQSWSIPPYAAGSSLSVAVTGRRTGMPDVVVASSAVTVSRSISGSVNAAAHLPVGSALVSPNGRYHLEIQGDGNVVVYDNSSAIWATGTNGSGIRGFDVQSDGNLVIYRASDGAAIWASNTAGRSPRNLAMQDDGNLVLYATDGSAIWASKGFSGALGAKVDAFVNKYNNKYVDYDGAWGAQCVDLFNFYNRDVVGAGWISVNYAYQLYAAAPSGSYEKLNASATPRKGDVAIWASSLPYSGGAGHVAVVLSNVDSSTISVFEQNVWLSNEVPNSPSIVKNESKAYLIGYLRPKG